MDDERKETGDEVPANCVRGEPAVPPKRDAIRRFERMLDVQLDTLSEIDTKAARLIGFLGVTLGLIVTLGRVIPTTQHASGYIDWSSVAGLTTLLIGIFGLLLSLVYATITYLSSEFDYGLEAEIADAFAMRETVPVDVYHLIVLRGYGNALAANQPIIQQNARRFRYALSSLVGSLFALTFSVGYYVAGLSLQIELITLVIAGIPVGGLCLFIRDEGYLTPESVSQNEERADGN